MVLVGRNQKKPKLFLKSNASYEQPQSVQYVNVSVLTQYTIFQASLSCSPTEIFLSKVPYSALNLRLVTLIYSISQLK